MEMPKPGPGHEMLQKLVGEWAGDETLQPSPWDPEGGPATGKVSNKVSLDGFFVMQDYEQTRGGRVGYKGHGVFGFDPIANQTVMFWFDGMGGMSEYRGAFTGDVLTVGSQNPMGYAKAIFDFGETDKYTFKMEFSQDGQQWGTFMQGTYSRVK